MHIRRLAAGVVILGWIVFAGAGGALAQSCPDVPAEHQAVVQAIRTMYAGAAKEDDAIVRKVIAPDFYAFDDGMKFTGMDLFHSVRTMYQDKGYVFVWTVRDPTVHTACDMAWITYTNIGSMTYPHGRKAAAQWLESAVLEKEHGRWLVRFFHSTLVQSPPPVPKIDPGSSSSGTPRSRAQNGG
ncbi:MAG TPA: nuclear transport factor 2 family protein [Candidatus Acidoferrum sp.]|nr:nuclear transport factor 2 family protein [Candidatus Acidoferrum sp.]